MKLDIIIGIIIIFLCLIYAAKTFYDDSIFRQHCEEQNGISVKSSLNLVCVDATAIKKIEMEKK